MTPEELLNFVRRMIAQDEDRDASVSISFSNDGSCNVAMSSAWYKKPSVISDMEFDTIEELFKTVKENQ